MTTAHSGLCYVSYVLLYIRRPVPHFRDLTADNSHYLLPLVTVPCCCSFCPMPEK